MIDVRFERPARLQVDAGLGEALDLVGDDARLALLHLLEEVAVRHEGDALAPGPVAGREVLGGELGADDRRDARQQLLLRRLGVLERHAGEQLPHLQPLAAHDLVDPLLRDLERAQLVGHVVDVAPRHEVGRRALQHGDVGGLVGDRGDQRRGGRARADHHDPLALQVEVVRPGLRVDDAALEVGEALPLGRIAFVVAIVALAHPEEVAGEAPRLAGVGPDGLDGPEVLGARPARPRDLVAIADVAVKVVLLDHLAHVFADLVRGGDRRADPGLEAVAEGVEVAVGADAGILVGQPGAAEALQRVQHHEALAGRLLGQVVGGADAGDSRADDQHVEVLRPGFRPVRAQSLRVAQCSLLGPAL